MEDEQKPLLSDCALTSGESPARAETEGGPLDRPGASYFSLRAAALSQEPEIRTGLSPPALSGEGTHELRLGDLRPSPALSAPRAHGDPTRASHAEGLHPLCGERPHSGHRHQRCVLLCHVCRYEGPAIPACPGGWGSGRGPRGSPRRRAPGCERQDSTLLQAGFEGC